MSTAVFERARRAEEVAEAGRRRVRFELVYEGGHRLGVQDEVTDFEGFEADGENRYLLARTMDPDLADHVVVTWHHHPDRSDERRTAKLLGP
ncbi:hypothetical protein FPZ12_024370 [Amycolatopsis acidicola]|uniref:Uncharacterized protein n=1 Tax=Amycolatopsis acidicola TaxID=2596893 RepID=A0A5N0UYT9_9PSEU|nr:hypothetical protein [Amycolatopsis acidicola]KAA9157778.1 hypothetical protein FPZ12_024370 [Amycolatopsis acidicola]